MRSATARLICWLAVGCCTANAQSTAPSLPDPTGANAGQAPVSEATPTDATPQATSGPQVRIVRLSEVKGQVQLDRGTSEKFDTAFANLPIVAGTALRTRQGLAEVEFEDNSSLRLTPESEVNFPQLGRTVSGIAVTAVNAVRGSLYVSLAGGKSNGDFTLTAGKQTILMTPSTHLRLDLNDSGAKLVVYQGSATISGQAGSLMVTKRRAITFGTASAAAPKFIQVGEAAPFDNWDKNAMHYHKVNANTLVGGLAGSSFSYGINDLSYYGSFSDIGGCGSMWRPHLADATFYPYASGVWSWYPGQGYSWVSLYPWGWAPFHSGSWDYCPAGGGWGWRPQGSWHGLLNHPSTILHGPVRGPVHGPVRPTPPPTPPGRGQPTLIGVNLKALEPSRQEADGKFVFRAGSAGLGVPRGVFNNYSRISQQAETHGLARTTLSERQSQAAAIPSARSSAGGGTSSFARTSPSSHAASASSSSRSSASSVSSASVSSSASRASSAPAVSGGAHH